MKFGNKLRTVAVVAAVSLALTAAGWAVVATAAVRLLRAEASAPAEDANLAITFLPKNLGNPYFDTSAKGGEAAVKEFGGTYAEVGPAEATPDAQVSYINTLTQQQVGAIVISANDKQAVCDALTEARDTGVKVVTFDSDTNPECRDLFVNQATAEGIAKVQIDMIAEQIGDSGEIAILSASANATNQNAWIELMKKELANHPNIKLVDTVYGNDKDQESFDKTAALLQSHPDLKGIISPTTVGIAAAARYLSTSDAKGKVALTGLGTPNQMREYVKDGTVKEFALWNPEDLGYLSAFAAKAVIPVRSRATKVTSSPLASSASTPSAPTRPWCLAIRSSSTRRTSTSSTSESVIHSGARHRPQAGHRTLPTTSTFEQEWRSI